MSDYPADLAAAEREVTAASEAYDIAAEVVREWRVLRRHPMAGEVKRVPLDLARLLDRLAAAMPEVKS